MARMRCALQFSLIALFIACGSAKSEIVISGRVVDENNTAVPLAVIQARRASDLPSPEIRTSSGPAGAFELRLSGPGSFLITVQHPGFFPLQEKRVELLNSSQTATFILNHLSVMSSSVQVTEAGGAVDLDDTSARKSVTNIDLVNIPYQGRDVAFALKLYPGVVQDSNGGLHLAGSALNQVQYTLDGFNITDPLHGTFVSRLNADAVQSVQYSNARYSAEHGKGSAGTVAIQTRMGSDKFMYNATNFVPGIDTNSGAHIGTWSPRFELSGPILKKRIWFMESAEAAYSELVVEDVQGRNRTPSLKLDNLLRTQVNLSERRQLFVSFLFNSTNSAGTGLSALAPYSTTVDHRSRTWFYSAKQANYLKNGAVIEWGYAEDRTFARQIPQGTDPFQITPFGKRGNFFLNSTEDTIRRQLILNVSPRRITKVGVHNLKIGMDLDRIDYDAQNRRTSYELWALNGKQLNQVTFTGAGVYSRANLELAGYAVDSWKLKPSLTVELGLRLDWDALLRDPVLSPRISAAWGPFRSKNTKFTGGYGITRDTTSLEMFSRPLDQNAVTVTYDPDGNASPLAITYFTIGNNRLRAPKYRNWTAGVERRLPRNIDLTAEYVRKRGEDGLTYLASPNAGDPAVNGIFTMCNYRRDVVDSMEMTVRQSFGKQYEWMASYTRSRALSNAVIDLSVDEPLWITNNVGRMPWDAPNRVLSWGIFPTPLHDWSVAYYLDTRNGFPFSEVTDWGGTVGEVNSHRYPMYFDLDVHVERRLRLGKRLVAIRAGFNNVTNHKNPAVVNNVVGAPGFMSFYGSQGRHLVFRLRWLGTHD
jgi:hypothetical protein